MQFPPVLEEVPQLNSAFCSLVMLMEYIMMVCDSQNQTGFPSSLQASQHFKICLNVIVYCGSWTQWFVMKDTKLFYLSRLCGDV